MQPTIYTLSANTSSFNISGLEPGTVYTISVKGMYENAVQGVRVQLQFTTLEEGEETFFGWILVSCVCV